MARKRPNRKHRHREPSGRLSRKYGEDRQDMTEVVTEARERVLGLSKTQAKEAPETTRLGRLLATGEISRRQFDAGSQYRDVVYRRDRALGVRRVQPAGDMDRQGGFEGDESTEEADRNKRALRDYRDCWQALLDASREDAYALQTVDAVVLHDWDIPHFTPSLRVGLNNLARAMRIPEQVEVDNAGKSGKMASVPYKSELRSQAVKA